MIKSIGSDANNEFVLGKFKTTSDVLVLVVVLALFPLQNGSFLLNLSKDESLTSAQHDLVVV